MVTPGERQGIGCLGSIVGVLVLVAIVVAAIFVGVIVLGIVAAVAVIGMIVLAVDRLLLAISPKRRERRANLQRSFMIWGTGQPPRPGQIVDTTAHLNDPRPEPKPEDSDE
jgi:hypothetical protein